MENLLSAHHLTDEELIAEVKLRGLEGHVQTQVRQEHWCPTCRGKWKTYIGAYDADGLTLRCHGCLRAVAKCTCR